MLDLLKKYTAVSSVSGNEKELRNLIIDEIKDHTDDLRVDGLGNLIVFKKGKKTPINRTMLDAHMDEIGLIVTTATSDGYLRFSKVGGIDNRVIFGKRVRIGDICGVIGGCAVHLLSSDKRKAIVDADELYIDIGAKSKDEALSLVPAGSVAVFESKFYETDTTFFARGIDDKIGCAVLTHMIKNYDEYDMYYSFSVQEEVGCRGAKVTAYNIDPKCAIAVECTTAADISGVPDDRNVCCLSNGAALSLMDNGTLYDAELVYNVADTAEKYGAKTQMKKAVAGGNNASALHLTRCGVKTIAVSLPCRYIHSPNGIANKEDAMSVYKTVVAAANKMAAGEI
ncbi:MAG: M42 family peptidase [Clostridia bacterium]|nr:M42 family peptidase [Clostridia bacterium]MEE1023497.1 M42 family peptidase [Acutalibacteraceae bacterium]